LVKYFSNEIAPVMSDSYRFFSARQEILNEILRELLGRNRASRFEASHFAGSLALQPCSLAEILKA
jgi:hypothetical protein